MISIFQIYFNEDTKKRLEPEFIPYFNDKKDGFFENMVIREIYEKIKAGTLQLNDDDYIGITSWKQQQKTNLKAEEIIFHIQDEINKGTTKDVYLYPSFNTLSYSYNDVPAGYYCNAVKQDIDIWEGHANRGKEVTDLDDLLNNSKVLPYDLYDGKWQYCYSNYWLAKRDIFIEYCEKVLLPALIHFEQHPAPEWFVHSHEKKKYPSYSFTFEGLFGSFLAHSSYSFSYICQKHLGGKMRKINILEYKRISDKKIVINNAIENKIIADNNIVDFVKILRNKCGLSDEQIHPEKITWHDALKSFLRFGKTEEESKLLLKEACGIPINASVSPNTFIKWNDVIEVAKRWKKEEKSPPLPNVSPIEIEKPLSDEITIYSSICGSYDKERNDIIIFRNSVSDKFRQEVMNAKIYKILPHKYFKTGHSIWMDGNVYLKEEPNKLLKEMGNADIALFRHPSRKCVYEEYEATKKKRTDIKLPELEEQLVDYANEGMPVDFGLAECGVLIRVHNPVVEEFNNRWWTEICRYCSNDQISFSYVWWKMKDRIKIKFMDGNVRTHPYFKYIKHNKNFKNESKSDILG